MGTKRNIAAAALAASLVAAVAPAHAGNNPPVVGGSPLNPNIDDGVEGGTPSGLPADIDIDNNVDIINALENRNDLSQEQQQLLFNQLRSNSTSTATNAGNQQITQFEQPALTAGLFLQLRNPGAPDSVGRCSSNRSNVLFSDSGREVRKGELGDVDDAVARVYELQTGKTTIDSLADMQTLVGLHQNAMLTETCYGQTALVDTYVQTASIRAQGEAQAMVINAQADSEALRNSGCVAQFLRGTRMEPTAENVAIARGECTLPPPPPPLSQGVTYSGNVTEFKNVVCPNTAADGRALAYAGQTRPVAITSANINFGDEELTTQAVNTGVCDSPDLGR